MDKKEFNSEIKLLCEIGKGTWYKEYCNYISEEHCKKLNGVYDDCPKRCGNDPNVECITMCEPWCIVEK